MDFESPTRLIVHKLTLCNIPYVYAFKRFLVNNFNKNISNNNFDRLEIKYAIYRFFHGQETTKKFHDDRVLRSGQLSPIKIAQQNRNSHDVVGRTLTAEITEMSFIIRMRRDVLMAPMREQR